MRAVLIAVAAGLTLGLAGQTSANTTVLYPNECYDVVLQGDMTRRADVTPPSGEPNLGLQVEVTKTFVGGPVADRIDVTAAGYPLAPKIFKQTLFLLAREPGGAYHIVRAAAKEPVDGRGLLSRGQVSQLLDYMRVPRCAAA